MSSTAARSVETGGATEAVVPPQHDEGDHAHDDEHDHAEPGLDPGGDDDRREVDDGAENEPERRFLALERVLHLLA